MPASGSGAGGSAAPGAQGGLVGGLSGAAAAGVAAGMAAAAAASAAAALSQSGRVCLSAEEFGNRACFLQHFVVTVCAHLLHPNFT